jgi:FKBP-type peptidyl-prolyl cis-trans isomerase
LFRIRYILFGIILLLVASCTPESQKERLLQQERAIEAYILSLENNQSITVYAVHNIDGVYRVVLGVGEGDGAAAGDLVSFTYNAYVFSSGKGSRYTDGRMKDILGAGNFFEGLEKGLRGMQVGEYAEIILTGKQAYGDMNVGILPAYTPVIIEVWMDNIEKKN